MARKQVSIQDSVDNDEDFEAYLRTNFNRLICVEVYSEFCGPCIAAGNAIRKGKLDIGQDNIAMLKAQADNIEALTRFRNRSEPTFLFIVEGKLTQAMFGANGIELCRVIEEELTLMFKERQTGVLRPKHAITEMLPEEALKMEEDMKAEVEAREAEDRLRVLTLAARKKRVCERLARSVKELNFILFWPHCHNAHFELYEKWDQINISVAAKDEFQLNEELAKEALYMSDVELNDACLHALTTGPALVTMFKMSDDGRDFVKLMRRALYEDIPVPKEDTPPEKQLPPIPAFERYATISKTAPEVRRDRYNAMMQKKREEQEERDRLAAEQARLARQAEEERLAEEKARRDEEKMARIAAGLPGTPPPEIVEEEELADGEETPMPPDSEPADESVVPEEEKLVEEQEAEFHSNVSVEGEDYIPPGGLFVPGLYSPPNELAKANALALFFPKIIKSVAGELETEFLPEHLLVMFHVEKRADVMEIIAPFRKEILNLGIFVGDDLSNMEHLAYSVKQYNKMSRIRRMRDRLVLMVSRKRSYPLLQLAGLNPCYISSDLSAGERECLQLFPVGYGDDFEEEESLVEEEIEEKPPEPDEPEKVEEVKEEEDEDEED